MRRGHLAPGPCRGKARANRRSPVLRLHLGASWPAGFMFSNAADLARFTIAFMNGGIYRRGAPCSHRPPSHAVDGATSTSPSNAGGRALRWRCCWFDDGDAPGGAHRLPSTAGRLTAVGASIRDAAADRKAAPVILDGEQRGRVAAEDVRAGAGTAAPLSRRRRPASTPDRDGRRGDGELRGAYWNGSTRTISCGAMASCSSAAAAVEVEVVKTARCGFR